MARQRGRSALVRLVLALLVLTSGMVLAAPVASAGGSSEPVPTGRPAGADPNGTDEWYSMSLPDGTVALLGVYRPADEGRRRQSVLVMHGKDGPRRLHEELARRFRDAGFIAVVACWFEYDPPQHDNAVRCPEIGSFTGATPDVVENVSAIIDGAEELRGVSRDRLGIVGHSYGARVSLLQAATYGSAEPVVSACGFLGEGPLPGEDAPEHPAPADPDVAAGITTSVLVVHGEVDPIVPVAQADAFVATMRAAGHEPDFLRYAAPAGHTIPWDVVAAPDEPGLLLRDRFIADAGSWLREHLEGG